MKYLKSFKILENLEKTKDENLDEILDELSLWNIEHSYNIIDGKIFLGIVFEYPDRVDKYEIDTISKVLKRLKPSGLDISRNELKNDIIFNLKLNDNLEEFDCTDNQYITILPELPNSILKLRCEKNKLKELPKLPDSLNYLDCAKNQLKVLPELPEKLEYLYCDNNEIEKLPDLPETLRTLRCDYNKLKDLPELPKYLHKLYCGANLLKDYYDTYPRNSLIKYKYDNKIK